MMGKQEDAGAAPGTATAARWAHSSPQASVGGYQVPFLPTSGGDAERYPVDLPRLRLVDDDAFLQRPARRGYLRWLAPVPATELRGVDQLLKARLGAGLVQLRQIEQLRRHRAGVGELERARRRAMVLDRRPPGRWCFGRISGPSGA